MRGENMEKKELFSIGEVSRLYHVSVSTLRHYDRISLLKPEVSDPKTGYRYYSVRQFECLNTIRYLRALDTPLDEIRELLKNRDLEKICELLKKQKTAVKKRRQELERIERKIDHRLCQISDAMASQLEQITLIKNPPRRAAAIRAGVAPRSWLDLECFIRELEGKEEDGIIFLGKVGVGILKEHLEVDKYSPYDLVFLLLDQEDNFQGSTILLPEETALSIRFQGGHENAAAHYEQLLSDIRKRGLTICGFSREVTMIDYGLTNDASKFVTEIQIPVTGL